MLSGRGGIGVIRISGSYACDVWTSMLVSPSRQLGTNTSRILFRCMVIRPETREVLDDGMAVFFHGPLIRILRVTSLNYTRAVLLPLPSSPLCHIPTLRPAEPGEFTRWAFESSWINLTEAEGIRDLVDAETDVQQLALRSATVIRICLAAKYLSLQRRLTLSSYQRPSGRLNISAVPTAKTNSRTV
ncbi:hypothetical protein BS47DRAFT_43727 [Hydnum rufescens UP504]|uniref:GTP-binding protein TrmE N-terminal domain-containing protein n=1 Tax=Hydnum rufescens UP504 TaxID=1448309 RepID=A0A9P6DTP7_9AGAM|nr:hypothetical protein BS47DRAFT_43727 [Hydnum rufescens UP504]